MTSLTKYQSARNRRRESITKSGRFRGGKLNPVMAVAVRPSEGGMLTQTATMELDPIPGRMITPITGEMISVFVPVQAIDAILDPAGPYSGMTEVIRDKLMTGNPLFGLENEGEISQRCGIEPRRIGGVAKVNQIVRLAHNAAVNYLRQRTYDLAVLLPHTNTAVTPAILSDTILDRLNGVLNPDDRVNGVVSLDLPAMSLPVEGIGFDPAAVPPFRNAATLQDTVGTRTNLRTSNPAAAQNNPSIEVSATNQPLIFAKLNATTAGNVSLGDFYNAENMDRLTREMDQIIQDNPEYGHEMVLRWAHGLSVDVGKTPFVIAEQKAFFQKNIVGALDSAGVNGEVMRSDFMMQMKFSVPIPKTELGGVIMTFLVVKPDETLATQPHPYLSDVWGLDNFLADELALDPVPVTARELDSGVAQASEATVMFYTGKHGLKQNYVNYGFTRNTNLTAVAAKTAIWQLQIPLSVTPQNILYPDPLSHYPFADQNAEVVTYTISSVPVIDTPLQFGPTPVEEIAEITTNNMFA